MVTIQLPGFRHPTLIQSIVWLEGEANYTKVHCLDGTSKLISQPLLWFERALDFIRVHKSAIVNPRYIVDFGQKRSRVGWVVLTTGLVLRVSRSRLDHTARQLQLMGWVSPGRFPADGLTAR